MGNPMNELWRAQQDAATRMAESWRTLLQPDADRTAEAPPPQGEADPGLEPVGTEDTPDSDTPDRDTPDSGTPGSDTTQEPEPEPAVLQAIRTLQALGDGQRDFARQMIRWADLQHELADAITAWAHRQEGHADALDRALFPFSPGAGAATPG